MTLPVSLPTSIVETSIPPLPLYYEGFLYRFTNLKNKKMYIGIHKGKYGDGYWNSSTNKEFAAELAGKGKFKYEILECGAYNTLTAREYEILKSEDAPNNPLYYNKTVGSPKFGTLRIAFVEAIAEKIRNGDFPMSKEPIDVVVAILRLQVRLLDLNEHQTEIAQKVDDNGGNTDGYLAVVLVNRNGEDLRIGGNHSVYGVAKSKYGKDIDVIRVPEAVHGELNDAEVRFLGNLLNKKPKVRQVELNEDDSIKQIVSNFTEMGTPSDDKSTKAMLIALGWTNKKALAIIKKAKVQIDTLIAKMSGKVKIDWDASPFDVRLDSILDDAKDANTMVITVSSGYVRNDRILHEIFSTNTGRIAIGSKEKKEIKIYVKHPSEDYYDKWKMGEESNNLKFLKYFSKGLGMTIRFIDLPMYESDIT